MNWNWVVDGPVYFTHFIIHLIQYSSYTRFGTCVVQRLNRALNSEHSFFLAWENSRHFAKPPLVFSQNDIWETSAEILQWWRVTIQDWELLLTGWSKFPWRHNQPELYYPGLTSEGRDTSSVMSMDFLGWIIRRHFADGIAKCWLFSQAKFWCNPNNFLKNIPPFLCL